MARRIQRKELKQDEFVDAAVDAGQWVEENWRVVALGAAVVVAVILGIAGWASWSRSRDQAASEELAGAIATFERAEIGGQDAPGLEQALASLDAAIDRAGGRPAGHVARFYRATTLHHLGRTDDAIAELDDLVDEDLSPTLGATARFQLARLYADAGRGSDAAALLEELVAAEQPLVPVPQALMLLADVRTQAGEEQAARAAWQRVADEFPESEAATMARARLGS
jgi:hypothetical protein